MAVDVPPVPFKERQRQERERLILQAAEELLLERGYHEMSIDDIAARVGISKGTVYLHFASKEDLVFALLDNGVRQLSATLNAILDTSGTPGDLLYAVIRQIYAGMVSPRRMQLIEAIFRSPELHGRLMERRKQFGDAWEGPRKRVTALLDEGKARGEFDPDMPTPLMLGLFWGILNPHQLRSVIVEEQLTSDVVVAHLCRFFFRGIAAHHGEHGDAPGDAPGGATGQLCTEN